MTDREMLAGLLKKYMSRAFTYEDVAERLLADGVSFAPDNNVGCKWIPVTERLPENFVSVLGYMADAGEFPSVRECYTVGNAFFFPALRDVHPVSHWMPMPSMEDNHG